jgi:hypothetical protein
MGKERGRREDSAERRGANLMKMISNEVFVYWCYV